MLTRKFTHKPSLSSEQSFGYFYSSHFYYFFFALLSDGVVVGFLHNRQTSPLWWFWFVATSVVPFEFLCINSEFRKFTANKYVKRPSIDLFTLPSTGRTFFCNLFDCQEWQRFRGMWNCGPWPVTLSSSFWSVLKQFHISTQWMFCWPFYDEWKASRKKKWREKNPEQRECHQQHVITYVRSSRYAYK